MHVDIFKLVVFCPLMLLSYFMLWHNVVPQMHCSGLAWHPDVATQMVLASEDDRLPVIQMWDLRFASSPLRVLESHTRYESYVACCSMVFALLVTAYQFVHLASCSVPCEGLLSWRQRFQQQAVLYAGLLTSQLCVLKGLLFGGLLVWREQAPK